MEGTPPAKESVVVRIPKERVAVLIGKEGSTKEMLERELNVRISVRGNEVVLEGEPSAIYFAEPVIRAIGRGFNPKTALKLKEGDYQLHIIDLHDYYNTENAVKRVAGRVIGRKGSIRRDIERATDSHISVYGHTVAVIAPYYALEPVLKVLEMIIRGAKHSTALNYLARMREELFYRKLKGGPRGMV